MTLELKMLSFAIALGFVQLLAAAHLMTIQRGMKWNLGARDEKRSELTGVAGRLDRAFKNFMETFPFFMGAVLVVTVLKAESSWSAHGAEMYFFGRLIYVPLYAAGIPGVRTACWIVASLGIGLILFSIA